MAKTDATKTFSEVLSRLIAESGMEYRPLAAAIGISQASLSKYAANDAEPGITALVKLAAYFNVSIDYLVGRTDVRSPEPSLQAAVEYTGLHEDAVEVLHGIQNQAGKELFLAENDRWGGIFDRFEDLMNLHSLEALSWMLASDDIWLVIRCMYAALIANLDDDDRDEAYKDAYSLSYRRKADITLRGVVLGEFYRQAAVKGFGWIFDGFTECFSDAVRRMMDGDENAKD